VKPWELIEAAVKDGRPLAMKRWDDGDHVKWVARLDCWVFYGECNPVVNVYEDLVLFPEDWRVIEEE